MKYTEYIIPIGEEAKEFDEIFIGVLRKHKELIRCKDCKHRVAAHPRYAPVTAICDLDTGDPFELGRNSSDDNWFCADGEKKEND